MKTTPFLFAFLGVFGGADAARIAYTYDNAGRIVTADYAGTGLTRFIFDAHGNLLSRTNTDDPLPPLAGTYFGLALNAAPTATNSASLSLTLGADGAFTGTLTIGSQRFTFRGVFAEDGTTANIVIDRKGSLADLTLTLALDVDGGTRRIDGTLTDGVFTSTLALDLSRYGRKADAVPAGLAGAYTALFLPTETTPGIPQGAGFATASLGSTGALRVAGGLADGTKFSLGSTLAGENVWAFYASLYKGAGLLAGNVTFRSDPGVSDFDGPLAWQKPATSGAVPGAFTTTLDFLGSKYTRPAPNHRALDFADLSPNAIFSTAALTLDATLDLKNKITFPDPNSAKLKLTLKSATGLLTGSLLDGGATRKLSGVLFLEQNLGAGFYLDADSSEFFDFTAKP